MAIFQGFRLEGVHCKLVRFVARLKVSWLINLWPCVKNSCHLCLEEFQVQEKEGLKMTSAQLLAKNSRFELTLKLKSDMIDEAKSKALSLTVFKGPC